MPAAADLSRRNRELIRRMHDALLRAPDPGRVDEFFAEHFVSHSMPPGLPPDREGVKRFLAGLIEGLPDLAIELDQLVAEGDLVTARTTIRGTHSGSLMGVPPSNRRVAIAGIDIMRVEDDRIVEHWGLTDTVGLLRQAGALRSAGWAGRHLIGRLRGRI